MGADPMALQSTNQDELLAWALPAGRMLKI
jgi:hypothetical protein